MQADAQAEFAYMPTCTGSCADPESFVRGGPTLITIFLGDEGRDDPNTT